MRRILLTFCIVYSFTGFSQKEAYIQKLGELLDYYVESDNIAYDIQITTYLNGKPTFTDNKKIEKVKNDFVSMDVGSISLINSDIKILVDLQAKTILLNKNYTEEENLKLHQSTLLSLSLTELKDKSTRTQFQKVDDEVSKYIFYLEEGLIRQLDFSFNTKEERLQKVVMRLTQEEAYSAYNEDVDFIAIEYVNLRQLNGKASYVVSDFIVKKTDGYHLNQRYSEFKLIKNYDL